MLNNPPPEKKELKPAELELFDHFLNQFIGPSGIHVSTVLEDGSINPGTKLLYLENAMTLPCHEYLIKLDQLYRSEMGNSNLQLIRSLKAINDFCFNNEVRADIFGTQRAISYYFGKLDNESKRTTEYINARNNYITRTSKKLLAAAIKSFSSEEDEKMIMEQKENREKEEMDLNLVNSKWRTEMFLPEKQLPVPQNKSNLLFATSTHRFTLKNLAPKINQSHLAEWQNNSKHLSFTEYHQEMLEFLLDEPQNYKPQDAINEIKDLSIDQVKTLKNLFSFNLRGDHLRQWQQNSKFVFTMDHHNALKFLLEDKKISLTEAINEIKGLSHRQAHTLQILYDLGLQGNHLRNWKSPPIFSKEHEDRLIDLMKNQKKSAAVAMNSFIEKESKEKEKKEIPSLPIMPQLALKTILDVAAQMIFSNKTANLGTKLLYLERAMSMPGKQFRKELDKLYQAPKTAKEIEQYEEEGISESFNLVAMLKRVNDLCMNNKLNAGDALQHYFKDESDVTQLTLTNEARKMVTSLMEEHQKNSNNIVIEKAERIEKEKLIEPNQNWRSLANLNEEKQDLRIGDFKTAFEGEGYMVSPYSFLEAISMMQNPSPYYWPISLHHPDLPPPEASAPPASQDASDILDVLPPLEDDLHNSQRFFSGGYITRRRQRDYKQEIINDSAEYSQAQRVTRQQLENWERANDIQFSSYHVTALRYLLSEQKDTPNMSSGDALEEIKGLNAIQVTTLTDLYRLGLRGHHLRNWDNFGLVHRDALKHLIEENGLAVNDAITAVKESSAQQLQEIINSSGPPSYGA